MRIPFARLTALLVLPFLLPACEDGSQMRGCPTLPSFDWRYLNLSLEQQTPGDCPVLIGRDSVRLEAGGVVNASQERDLRTALLAIRNSDGRVVGGVERPFESDPNGRWIAAVYTNYWAGTIPLLPDAARFQLYYANQQIGPFATVTITYTDQVRVSISGPGVVQSGSMATWTADIGSGQAPFTYYWYADGLEVGNGESYTAHIGASGWLDLRLDVFDADGHAGSTHDRILINECEPPILRC
jgi:hypothetical protein